VIVLGDGVAACRPFLAALGAGVQVAPATSDRPSAAIVGRLGHAMLESGQVVEPDALVPMYLRPSEVELGARRA
jgi:tRNA A37 threonylcarbamoyladenosine modification protein TsaB